MHSFIENQNQPNFIRLLKAMNKQYSIAKTWQGAFDIVAVCLALCAPILIYFFTEFKLPISIIATLLSCMALVIDRYQKRLTKEAATIQEEFDTDLYQIQWNKSRVGNKIDHAKVSSLSTKNETSDSRFIGWFSYKLDSSVPNPMAISICQYSTISYDLILKKRFRIIILILGIAYYIGFTLICIINKCPLGDVGLSLLPTIAFFKYLYVLFFEGKDFIEGQARLTQQLQDIFQKYRTNKEIPEIVVIRQIQDMIYESRCKNIKVPDRFYLKKRDELEKAMHQSIEDLCRQIV